MCKMITDDKMKSVNENPFNLVFGKEPSQVIARYNQRNEIVDSFNSNNPSQYAYMITGVRGSGKTVFMTQISKGFERSGEWVVIEINSSGEIMKEVVSKLYSTKGLSHGFELEGIDLSFWGLGAKIKRAEPLTDLETAASRMIERIKKDGKKLLIAIDEVTNTPEMKYFASAFQILIRKELPVFLLMTGLYENINKLQNEDNLTFLYRAPKIYLSPLNIFRIADIYEKQLEINKEKAKELARMTKGYSFAFQVFGFFTYVNNGDYEKALPDIRQYLDEYVYDKTWIELSEKEKTILICMADNKIVSVSVIKEKLNLKPNEFSVYRDRLLKKGILDGSTRGKLDFSLPFFDEYIKEHYAG